MPLTDMAVRNARPEPKPIRLYDERGLYLQLAPSGGKWWRFKYRFGGREKLLSLGTYPEVSLREARVARDAARAVVQSGADPSAARKLAASQHAKLPGNSLREVTMRWLAHRESAWTQGTYDAIKASLDAHVLKALGDEDVSAVTAADIRRAVIAVENSGAAETASRVLQRLKSVYRHAIANELVKVDPTYALKPSEILKPRRVRHRAALPASELPAFLRALASYPSPTTRTALQLLMLTAVRPGELRGARWEEIDEDSLIWRIPGERMKMSTPHLVPLSRQALQLLNAMKPFTGSSALIFESDFYPNKSISENTLNSAIARLGYKGAMTAHGARAIFSTAANESGKWQTDAIERALAHEERDSVRGAYNRAAYLQERRAMAQWWADYLDSLALKTS